RRRHRRWSRCRTALPQRPRCRKAMADWFRYGIPQHVGPVDVLAILPYIAIACVLGFILLIVPGLIWIERVVIALMQDRLGPNRVGPRGLLQTIADGVKLFFKEDVEPRSVGK